MSEVKIGGFDLYWKWKQACRRGWGRAAPWLRRRCAALGRTLALYLDDLLLLGGGVCFVCAAYERMGRPAALAVAGVCLVAYALVIARSRRGGDGKCC